MQLINVDLRHEYVDMRLIYVDLQLIHVETLVNFLTYNFFCVDMQILYCISTLISSMLRYLSRMPAYFSRMST